MELVPVQDSDQILHTYLDRTLSPTVEPVETMDGPYDQNHDDEPNGYSTVPNLTRESSNQGSRRHTEESNKPIGDGAWQQRRPDWLPLLNLLLTISILVLAILIFIGKYFRISLGRDKNKLGK